MITETRSIIFNVNRAPNTVIAIAISVTLPTLWPPNSPDLNPVDYKIWSCMQEMVYKTKVRDVDDLHQHIMDAWEQLDQRVIDKSVQQWRVRLRACVDANGGHFECRL